jgi:cobalamin biosynthesis Mg chelatase CobN
MPEYNMLGKEELIMRGLHIIGANPADKTLQLHEVLVTE